MIYLNDFISLVFPRICAGCGNSLWKNEKVLCRLCDYHLPKTDFHLDPDNPVARLFWGRAGIETASAFFYFNKGSRVQRMVHQLKYRGRKDIGIHVGQLYGRELRRDHAFPGAGLIVPVPLHRKKYMQRGYNQSEQFAIGLSSSLGIPVNRHLLVRTGASGTQTRKSRYSRYRNVKGLFTVVSPQDWTGVHILLVDDVVTTGATLEACVRALKEIPGVRISIACIATAMI